MSLSARSRAFSIKQMQENIFDLFIIGGGINGAGVARDACSRGMKVALAEASDYASGTSSRSSKLLHGGIRYLENFEFGLVFEALSERNLLLEIAPHMAHPLRFMIPVFEKSRVGFAKLGLGMWAYDVLALFRAPELHARLNESETREQIPSIRQEGLLGSFLYSDAYMDDDRLVFETLRSADSTGHLVAGNYLQVQEKWTEGELQCFRIHDLVDGNNFVVRARHAVAAAGPWTDQVGTKLHTNWKKVLRPTKGVHLTFLRERLPLPCAVVMAIEDRIVFAIPRHEMVLIGTTDTDEKKSPEEVVTDSSDVDYLLQTANSYFPGAQLTRSDIVACYAGVRPLVLDDSKSEGKTSREHKIWSQDQVTYVSGGKYTTYRKMSEQVLLSVLSAFPIADQVRWNRSDTKVELNPLITEESHRNREQHLPWLLENIDDLEQNIVCYLERHSAEAPEFVRRFGNHLKVSELEALIAIHTTQCRTLSDFYLRRVSWFLSEKNHGLDKLEEVAGIFSRELQLKPDEVERQKQDLKAEFTHLLKALK